MVFLVLLFAFMAVVALGDRTTTFTTCSPVQTLNWLGVDIFTFNLGVATGFIQFNVAGSPVEGPAFMILEVGGLKLIKDLDHNKVYNPTGLPLAPGDHTFVFFLDVGGYHADPALARAWNALKAGETLPVKVSTWQIVADESSAAAPTLKDLGCISFDLIKPAASHKEDHVGGPFRKVV